MLFYVQNEMHKALYRISATFFINILNSLNCVVKLCLHWNVVHIRCGWRTEVSCGDSDNKT